MSNIIQYAIRPFHQYMLESMFVASGRGTLGVMLFRRSDGTEVDVLVAYEAEDEDTLLTAYLPIAILLTEDDIRQLEPITTEGDSE